LGKALEDTESEDRFQVRGGNARKTRLVVAGSIASILILLLVSPIAAGSTLTPTDIRGAYNVAPLLQSGYTGKGVTVAIVNKGIDSSFYDDVKGFNAKYGLPDTLVSVVRPYGSTGTDQELPEGETTADAQLVHVMAPDARILLVLVGTHSLLDGFSYVIDNDAADVAVLGPSWAFWGQGARDLVQSYNSRYAKSVDKKITLIAASNDWGSNNTVPWGTVVGDFWTQHLPDSYLMPQYSPYVTSVGGTVLTVMSGSYGSESGWDRSGGGPSNLFIQPSWQTGSGVPNNGFRNVPDLALNAACETSYAFYWRGDLGSSCGTGDGALVFAGIVADMVQAAGGRLGFLNSVLYSVASSDPSVFHDVTSGCSLVKVGSDLRDGYCASKGWDFVTGWGSPDAVKLAQHFAPNASIVPEFSGGQAAAIMLMATIIATTVLTRRSRASV
jgi:subtilase family serine protease